ncbi:HlyD family efflux transporter periplasmic adaptor subunit [Kribbella sp. NBC_01510]|uniref:efflux RND transporter periplasmic adaptor subunit n=1 Tax=Kribbella sp. NBC_01510 TaxID=2903581 RepID=UPI0038661678
MVLPRHKLRGLSFVNVALVAIVLAIALTAYFLFFRKDQPAASATRPTAAVARGDVTASVSSSGTLQSSQNASPQFETSGTVTQILVKVGQVVAKGAAVAKVDPSAAERQLRIADQNQIAAANSVTAAQESLDDAQNAAEAAAEASASPSPTPTNGQQQTQSQNQTQNPEVAVSNAEASLARAKADKEQADQDVEGAQAAVDATTLKAPIAGTITAINGSVGSVTGGSSTGSGSASGSGSGSTSGQGSGSTSSSTTTTSGSGFVDISDLKALQVVASFAEADAIKIKAGQSATVTLNAEPGTTLTATLVSVSPTPTTTNGVVSYSATFSLAKLPANARIGQTANVTVQTAKATNALYVPSTAIATSGTTYTVTMADGGGTREVKVGVRGGSFTQITSGLNEGDRIDLLQGTIGGTTNQTGQGRQFGQGQFPAGGGQFPGVGAGTGGGGNRGR